MSGQIVLLSPYEGDLNLFTSSVPEGAELTLVDENRDLTEIVASCRDAVAIIAPYDRFPMELARACPKLKLVQSTGAGTDKLPVAELGEAGILVANNGGGSAAAVAEHAIGLMISVYRKLHVQFRSVDAGAWAGTIEEDWFSETHELTRKTVGLVGIGATAQEVARRLRGWGCRLTYTRARDVASPLERELSLTRLPMEELLRTSDIVSLHLPLTAQTEGIIGAQQFEMMKPTAVLINTSRGGLVDQEAMTRALTEGRLAGAGLDTLEGEPPPLDNPLLAMDRVVVTPHLAWLAQEGEEKCRAFAVRNAQRVVRGAPPQSVVQPHAPAR